MNAKSTLAHRPQSGFTLLELLISLTLLGMMLVLLFGGLRLGMRSWDTVQVKVDSMNSVRSVENFLRREMERVYPYRWNPGPAQRFAFLGERYKVNFVAPLPTRIASGGLYAIAMELEQNGEGRKLTWKHMPIDPQTKDFSALDQVKEMVLVNAELSKVDDIWLSYFGREKDGAEPRWVDHWDSIATMPLLIRVQVRFTDGSEWPEFIVAPQLNTETPR